MPPPRRARLARALLRRYVLIHDRLHRTLVFRLGRAIYGVHPKNVFNHRWPFFARHVEKTDVVLDVACGTGSILSRIADRIGRGVGIDVDPGFAREWAAACSAGPLEFRVVDFTAVDFAALRTEVPYDVAIFSHILEHVGDVPALLIRVGAPRVLICVPSVESWYEDLRRALGITELRDPTHHREYTRAMLADELERAGYRVTEMGFNGEGEIVCRADR